MTTIALRKYNELINSMIDQEKYQEAISHCTTILNSYPKCIDTYQSLGRALLENRQFEEAENVFSKILSVFPEDFSAHAALSEINEENRELDRAIWHMERAFETQPSNLNIQEEMRRLVGRRDGTPPAKVRLTRGALIRMYAKGDLYQQAIAETLSALEADPDRTDLKVLLARFYHATGANSEAASTCSEILSTVPYCYEANRIMFDLSTQSNEIKFDPIYHERLSELDPYYRFVEDGKQDVNLISDEKVILEIVDFVPGQEDTSAEPDWAQKIGLSWQDTQDESEKTTTIIDPLRDVDFVEPVLVTDSAQATPFLEDFSVEAPELTSQTSESTDDALPDWIAKAGWIRATDEENPPAPFEATSEDLVVESVTAPAEPANDLPDWLKSLNREKLDSPEVLTPTGDAADLDADIPPLTPDMLNEILADDDLTIDEASKTTDQEAGIEQEIAEPGVGANVQIGSIIDEEIPELPDWLKDLDTGEINVPADVALESQNPSLIDQDTRSEMADFIDELSSTNLLGSDEPPADVEDELESPISSVTIEEESIALEGAESTPDVIEPPTLTSESIEKDFEKPAVPSWVSKILAGSVALPKIVNAVPSTPERTPLVSERAEETIPELIQDLPEIDSGEGVISEEVNKELESWLSDINPEDTQPIELQIESPLPVSEETEPFEAQLDSELPIPDEVNAPLITFDSLVEPLPIEETLETEAVMPNEQIEVEGELADSTNLQDRLSSMLGIEETTEVAATTEETEILLEQPSAETGLKEKLRQLLHSGEYTSFLNTISFEDIPVETADEVIQDINEELQINPGTFELWQSLGDIQSKKANLGDALSAYKEAEKYLFQ